MKKALLLFFGIVCSVTVFSQAAFYSVESGALINTPLVKTERVKSEPGFTFQEDWTYKYYRSSGYYVKADAGFQIGASKKWTFFMPFGISYMNQMCKYHREGFSYGCFGGESANELKVVTNQLANLNGGFSARYTQNKFSFSSSLLLNNCVSFSSKTNSYPYNSNDAYGNVHPQMNYRLYMSSSVNCMYGIQRNLLVGPSCEVFFANVNYGFCYVMNKMGQYPATHTVTPSTFVSGKNIWVNPGIKFQFLLQ